MKEGGHVLQRGELRSQSPVSLATLAVLDSGCDEEGGDEQPDQFPAKGTVEPFFPAIRP